ncbi:DUF2071 domain-containing protein [Halapricum sp. CBA1109]|uniref:YqjF family protein n=1 Tax=Halapricum sp. CBA1109 TaxID=2668068 RepID=UPI0012F80A17|nr:DUF2071 domain-containing protein [Halapricum sp. CBA1109]MUV90554.1 DUF2071 domain-containing protein [Halapricum sp. CBA1109]
MSTRSRVSRDVLSMTWRDVLFAHWPVDPDVVAPTLPEGLSVDTDAEGRAWLSVVGFVMDDIRPRFSPVGLSFPELNLRTYVRQEGAGGVYFYNLDADDRLGVGVARRLFQLPYYRAEMSVTGRSDRVHFRSHRTHDGVPPADFDAVLTPASDPEPVAPGSLDAFLVERYRFFAADDDGRLYYGDIDHDPWRVAEATLSVRKNTLFEAAGFDHPGGDPVVRYCPELPVTAGRLRRS